MGPVAPDLVETELEVDQLRPLASAELNVIGASPMTSVLRNLFSLVTARKLVRALTFQLKADALSRAEDLRKSFFNVYKSLALPHLGDVDAYANVGADESSAYKAPYLAVSFVFNLSMDPKMDSPEMLGGAIKTLKSFLEPKFKHCLYKAWPTKVKIRPAGNDNTAVITLYLDPDKTEDTVFKKNLDSIMKYMLELSTKYSLGDQQ